MIIWVMKILFVQFFCVFLPSLLNIFCFCSVHTISVLYQAHLCMKCSRGISNFLVEISCLFHSVLFPYFFALIVEGGFIFIFFLFFGPLHSDAYIFFFSLWLFASLLFIAIWKASPGSHFAFLLFFSMGIFLIPVSCTMPRTSFHSSSGTLSIRSRPLNLFLTSTV